jgi:hypothetical protein
MRLPRLTLVPLSIGFGLFVASALLGAETLHAPMPVGAAGAPTCDAPPCPPACPASPPKVVVELSQPEVHFTAPCRQDSGCEKGGCGAGRSKTSLFNLSISKVRNRIQGGVPVGAQPVTSIIPAFATATIPIAFQTTQFATFGAQSALVGTRQAAELTRSDIQDMVRQAFEREAAEREAAQRQAAERQGAQRQGSERDSCAELKARVEKIESRLGEVEKQVQRIATKLKLLP